MKDLFAYGEKVHGYEVRVLNEREQVFYLLVLLLG